MFHILITTIYTQPGTGATSSSTVCVPAGDRREALEVAQTVNLNQTFGPTLLHIARVVGL